MTVSLAELTELIEDWYLTGTPAWNVLHPIAQDYCQGVFVHGLQEAVIADTRLRELLTENQVETRRLRLFATPRYVLDLYAPASSREKPLRLPATLLTESPPKHILVQRAGNSSPPLRIAATLADMAMDLRQCALDLLSQDTEAQITEPVLEYSFLETRLTLLLWSHVLYSEVP